MLGIGIKTVEGRVFVSQRQPPVCTYLCTYNFLEACSSRNHVSHSWRSNASIGFSCGKPNIYVSRSSVLSICQQPGVFSLPLFPSCLAPSSSCSSSTFGVFLRFLHSIIRLSFIQAYHLSFFFNHLSTFYPVSNYFLSNYLSLLDRRSIFISPFIFSCTFPAFSSSLPFL